MADTLFKEKLEKVKRKKIVGNNISWKFSKIAVLKGQCQSEHFLTQNKALKLAIIPVHNVPGTSRKNSGTFHKNPRSETGKVRILGYILHTKKIRYERSFSPKS